MNIIHLVVIQSEGGVEHGTYVMGEIATISLLRAVQNDSLISTGLPTFLDILLYIPVIKYIYSTTTV